MATWTATDIIWIIRRILLDKTTSDAEKQTQVLAQIQKFRGLGTSDNVIGQALQGVGYSDADVVAMFAQSRPKLEPLDEKDAERQLSVATPNEAESLIRGWATQGVVSQEVVNKWWQKYTPKFDVAGAQRELGRLPPKEAQAVLDQWAKQDIGNAEDFDTLIDWYKTLPQPSDSEMQAVGRFIELGQTDLAQQTLARIPKDLADRYMEQAKYEAELRRATTLAEMEYKGKAKAEQVFGAGKTTGQQAIDYYRNYDPSKGPPPRPPTTGAFASEEEQTQMNEVYRQAKQKWDAELTQWQQPLMPTAAETAQPIIEQLGAGLAPGTRLRGFLESQERGAFVPQIAQETATARQDWWNRMYPALLPRKQQTGDLARIAQRAWESSPEYQALLRGKPQLEIAEGRAGGRRYAREYETETETWQRRMAQAKAAWGEDPLTKALREAKPFRPEYYRQPGTGLVPRLTPSVRF